jgi:hypothetical protein
LFGDPALTFLKPQEHNIGVQSLTVASHEPADTEIWINVTVYNNGNHTETDIAVQFLINGIEENSTVISSLENNTMKNVSWLYHTPSYGYELLCINVAGVPGETFLSDNILCREVVYGPDIAVVEISAPEDISQGFVYPINGTIENVGLTDEPIVVVKLLVNETEINSTTISLDCGEHASVSFMWDVTSYDPGTYDITIYAVPVSGESYVKNQNLSHIVNVLWVSILLIDDDQGPDLYSNVEQYYIDALEHLKAAYYMWDRLEIPDATCNFTYYDILIWFTGDPRPTVFSDEDIAELIAFLDHGGKLFLTSQDAAESLHNSGNPLFQRFLTEYLHVSYGGHTDKFLIMGDVGDEIGNELYLHIGYPSAQNQNSKDVLVPTDENITVLVYSERFVPTDLVSAVKYEDETYQVVFFGFGFEGISSLGGQIYGKNLSRPFFVMERVLGWFYLRGDTNDDGFINMGDVIFLTDYLYRGGPAPLSLIHGDANSNGIVDIGDVVYLINYLFRGGPPPEGCCG